MLSYVNARMVALAAIAANTNADGLATLTYHAAGSNADDTKDY